MNTPEFDVIGIGTVCWDIIGRVPCLPGADEKAEMTELLQQGGGPTATGIVAVARLGGKASIWGRIGDDDFGRQCMYEFIHEGVETHHLQVAENKTTQFAFCVAVEGTGQRCIYYKPGTAPKLSADEIIPEEVCNCRALLIGHHHGAAAVRGAQIARAKGIPVVLDVERPSEWDEALLEVADWPILPAEYVMSKTGLADPVAAGDLLARKHNKLIIVTLGVEGCVAFTEGQVLWVPAYCVAPVIDTTGAGDVFHGAFTYGLTLGFALEDNLRFSAATAALKCRALGGRTGIPHRAEVEALIKGT